MLHELAVRNLGVIEDVTVVLPPGLTALTGETGAGKTLITEAVALLLGARADPGLVGPGGDEAEIEGRFVRPGSADAGAGPEEVVVRRVIPSDGRSRAYIDGRLATAAALGEAVGDLVDIHGQHEHQALLRAPARREALDRFGGIDPMPLAQARSALRAARGELETLGGDDRVRAREIELLRFQIDELEAAGIEDANEDDELGAEERLLGDASSYRESALGAASLLGADGVVGDGLARSLAMLRDREPFAASVERLQSVIAEVADLAADLRDRSDAIPDDPARLVAIGERRRVLSELRRKYGATLDDVLAYWSDTSDRLVALEGFNESAARIEAQIGELVAAETKAAAVLGAARRKQAPKLAVEVQQRLQQLALPKAQIEIAVGDDPGDDIDYLVAMNAGLAAQPVAKAASGGELSRIMLALQMVVGAAAPTVIFDEVDAGVGGEAANAVGLALARVALGSQVLVVTHLPQVAAHADHQINIVKTEKAGRAATSLELLDDGSRVIELSRMLSGSPDSEAARVHAAELLEAAARARA